MKPNQNLSSIGPIGHAAAVAEVDNWVNHLANAQTVKDLFANGMFFQINGDFDVARFGTGKAHAYFGLNTTSSTGAAEELALLLIPESEDVLPVSPHPAPYIYRAPFVGQGFTENNLNSHDADNMLRNWNKYHQPWIDWMVSSSACGMTRVCDVPNSDIAIFTAGDELYVYPALSNWNMTAPYTPEDFDLIFSNSNSGYVAGSNMDDFITPKPPFGSGEDNNYSLLENHLPLCQSQNS